MLSSTNVTLHRGGRGDPSRSRSRLKSGPGSWRLLMMKDEGERIGGCCSRGCPLLRFDPIESKHFAPRHRDDFASERTQVSCNNKRWRGRFKNKEYSRGAMDQATESRDHQPVTSSSFFRQSASHTSQHATASAPQPHLLHLALLLSPLSSTRLLVVASAFSSAQQQPAHTITSSRPRRAHAHILVWLTHRYTLDTSIRGHTALGLQHGVHGIHTSQYASPSTTVTGPELPTPGRHRHRHYDEQQQQAEGRVTDTAGAAGPDPQDSGPYRLTHLFGVGSGLA